MRHEKSGMKLTKSFGALAVAIGLMAALVFAASALQNSSDHKVLFEKAKFTMETKGDLKGAIGLFEEIIKKYPNERDYAANSLLYIGICYEKLGKSEARSAYSRLLQDYGDQAQPVKEARSRLAKLEAVEEGRTLEKTGLAFRKIDFAEAEHSHQARLSPDGKKMLFVGWLENWERSDLRVLDFTSGKSLTLVEDFDADAATLLFEWSPDGKRVVYVVGRGELRLIDAEGGKSELLWASPEKETYVRPADWSDQVHAILISLINPNERTGGFAIIPEKGGEPRTILSADYGELEYSAQFSPDGRFVVGQRWKDRNSDIYVWAVEGGTETRVTDHPADDQYPFWSPDGKYIIFISNRAKTADLWAVPMAGSQPAGDPFLIQTNIGKNKEPIDLTKSGQLLFYAVSAVGSPADLFVMPVDPKTGDAQGSFRPFAKYPARGWPGWYRWSPDGSRIAYTSRKGNIQLPNAYISSGGSNEELEIPARNYFMYNVEWSRDGKSLVFAGWNNDDERAGIFCISLEDLTVKPVQPLGERVGAEWKDAYTDLYWLPRAGRYCFSKLLGAAEREIYFMNPINYAIEKAGEKIGIGANGSVIPSPDGRFFIGITDKDKNIILRPLGGGVSRALFPLPTDQWPGFSWSPDGKQLVWNEGRRLNMLIVPDGTPQVLFEAGQNEVISGSLAGAPNIAWSPDGSKIAFAMQDAASDSKAPAEIWIIDATGDAPRKIADAPASHPVISDVVWDPSGKMIFVQGQIPNRGLGEVFEHWVMENFLPKSASEK